jgi:glycosyltransferase involved in cell wall biosynthesis
MSLSTQVSIITPFLNAEEFLAEAVESVLAQTFRDWELLLVDDGSADASSSIAKEYACGFPERVRYFQHNGHRNLGKSSSRNLGLRNATGRYIAFLDADDVFLAEKLETQVAILEGERHAAMVYGRTRYWHGWTGKAADVKRDTISELGVQAGRLFSPPLLIKLFLTDAGLVPCLCALLIRREVMDHLGGFEESIQQLYEDQVLIAKICTTESVFVDDTVGEQYRQHPGSSSALAIRSREYDPRWPNAARLTFLQWLGSYIKEKRIDDRNLGSALRRALRPYQHPRLYSCLSSPFYLASMIKRCVRYIGKETERASR